MAELGMGNGHASHHVPTPETMAVRERSSTFTVSLALPCLFTAFSLPFQCLKGDLSGCGGWGRQVLPFGGGPGIGRDGGGAAAVGGAAGDDSAGLTVIEGVMFNRAP